MIRVTSLLASICFLEIRYWPAKMLGAPTDFSLSWIATYLCTFAAQLLLETDLPPRAPNSHDSFAGSERASRSRGDIRELESELCK